MTLRRRPLVKALLSAGLALSMTGLHAADDLLSVAPLRGPAPLVYRTTEPAAKPDRIEVKDMNAAQLRAYCKNIDSAFQPPEKANRTVFLMFLYGKGLITEAQAFKGD